jgi:hypothetical protein
MGLHLALAYPARGTALRVDIAAEHAPVERPAEIVEIHDRRVGRGAARAHPGVVAGAKRSLLGL